MAVLLAVTVAVIGGKGQCRSIGFFETDSYLWNGHPRFFHQGYTSHMVKAGDFRYSYFLWFETADGQR